MPDVQATVETTAGSRYLQQLAKHWSHRFEVVFDAEHAEIALPLGRCVLDATPDRLHVRLIGAEDGDLDRFQQVVAEHLARFAFRESLHFAWAPM